MRNIRTLLPVAVQGINGRNWYREAYRELDKVCRFAEWDPNEFASVLAITSPRVSVVRNIRTALFVMIHGELPAGVMVSTHRALANYRAGKGIAGQKTSAFRDALLGCEDSIVLDTWMAYALGIDQTDFNRIGDRAAARRRVLRVATAIGETPAATQAAIWTGYRYRSGYSYRSFPLWSEYVAAYAGPNSITGIANRAA